VELDSGSLFAPCPVCITFWLVLAVMCVRRATACCVPSCVLPHVAGAASRPVQGPCCSWSHRSSERGQRWRPGLTCGCRGAVCGHKVVLLSLGRGPCMAHAEAAADGRTPGWRSGARQTIGPNKKVWTLGRVLALQTHCQFFMQPVLSLPSLCRPDAWGMLSILRQERPQVAASASAAAAASASGVSVGLAQG
jgi:hypothetical protein